MKKIDSLKNYIKNDDYQVFLFVGPVPIPFSFAKHHWFVINKKGDLSRWEVVWRQSRCKTSWGYLHKNLYPPLQGIEKFLFSDKYFWKNSFLLGVIEGDEHSPAKDMAEFIENSPNIYPYCYQYSFIGTNSNSYAQWVLNNFPQVNFKLRWNSFGKRKAPKTT